MLLLYPLGRFGARKRRLPNGQAISSCLLVLRGTPSPWLCRLRAILCYQYSLIRLSVRTT